MAGLGAHLQGRHAGLHCTGSEASAQTVAGISGRIEAGSCDALADHEADGLAREPLCGDWSVPMDRSEYRPSFDPSRRDPAFKRSDRATLGSTERNADLATRALLVGLRAAQGDNDALSRLFYVRNVESAKLQ